MHKLLTKPAGLLGGLLLLAVSASATPPAVTPGSSLLYVNDASTTGDAYTNAVGSSTGDGSRNNPYDNIAAAIAVAGAGTTIYVDAGTYNVSTSMTIPAGVRLTGLCASSSTIILGNNASNTINVLSNAELSRFTITRVAPAVEGGQTTVSVSTTPGGTNMKINNCLFSKNRSAIYVNPSTAAPSAIIENNNFDDNRTGIVLVGTNFANLRIAGNNIVNNRTFGIIFTGATSLSNIVISNNNITGNLASQIEVDGSSSPGAITFQNNWVGSASPIISAGTVNGTGAFTVDDHNTGTTYPNVNFMDNNGGAPPNYPNFVSGSNTGALDFTGTPFAASARPFALPSCCIVATTNATGSNTPGGFLTIQDAVDNSNPDATITLCAATYNEQVLVNKSVTIQGTGTLQSVVNFTGTVAGKPTLFDVSAPNVTINNISLRTDLSKLGSAVIASGANVSNLAVTNNSIAPYGSTATNSSYGNRNAISINYAGYRVSGANTSGINISGNTISGLVASATGAMGTDRFFRSGVSADEMGGTFNGNTIQSINHDMLVRFPNQGAVNITNNNFNGGGVEVADINSGSGTISVTGNTFDATAANPIETAVLRLKNNNNSKTTLVSGNTFNNHEWALSTENYNTVTLNNNAFTPLANSTTYHHVTVNTKALNTNSNALTQVTIGATLTNNTFNGSGSAGGTAVGFYNHDNDNASFGTFVLGTAGNENNFAAGIAQAVFLDQQSGNSSSSAGNFPNYDAVIGTGTGANTTKAPWATPIDASNNKFDVGNGLETPAAMSLANLYLLENKIQHKIDLGTLGFVTVKANNTYVTPASFIAPNTAASVQRGVDAASNGFTVNVDEGTFNGTIAVNKNITLNGANAGISGLGTRVSETNLVSTPSCISLATGSTLTVDGFAFNGRSFVTGGTSNGLSVLNCKITTDAPANSNCIYLGQPFTTFNVLNNDITMTSNCQATLQPVGDYAGTGTGNTVNISGNRFMTTVATPGDGVRPVAVNVSSVQGQVTQNQFSGIDIGVLVANAAGNLDVSQNVFDGLVRSAANTANNSFAAGVVLFQLSTTGNAITIRNNEFKNSDVGVRTSATTDFSAHAVNINDNAFTNNQFFHLRNAATAGTFNATCNWFGTTNSTVIAAKIQGSVNYTPYRTDGTDTSAAIGFQPGTPCAGACTIVATAMATPTTCPANNGTVTATVDSASSVAPYTYSLNGGTPQSSSTFTGLMPGTYTVTVTDNTGCTASDTAKVITNGPVHNTTTGVDYCSIQSAVTAASANDMITVDAGVYSENVTVATNGLTIKGSNAGTSGSATRANAESIVRTNGSNQNAVFNVTASGVTIDGFTIDGDDPAATFVPIYSGSDVNAFHLVLQGVTGNNLTVTNNILKKAFVGIRGSGHASQGNVFSNNLFDDIGNYDFGYAITLRDNYYANITNNKMTRVFSGVHINNFSAAGPATFTMSGNTISSYASGLSYWLQYGTATGLTVDNNQFSAEANAVMRNNGIQIQTIQNGVNPSFTNNTITGTDYGVAIANVPTTATITLGATNTITGTKVAGIQLTDSLFNPLTTNNLTQGQSASAINVNGVAITAASGAGVALNTVNAANTLQTINFGAATTITNGATGLLVNGNHAAIGGNNINNVTFVGQTGNYVALSNGGLAGGNLTATGTSFDGQTGSSATLAQNFAIEDKIIHKLDTATLGFVTVKANNDFVTTNSGSIQRGINAASAGFNVNVAAGTFNDSVVINKQVMLLGAQAGVCAATARTGGESVINSAKGTGVNASGVTIDGFTMQGQTSSAAPGNGFAVYMQPNSTGTQLLNNIIRNNRIGSSLSNKGTNPTQVLVSCNLFDSNNQPGASSGNGIYTDNSVAGGAMANVTISQNTFTGNTNAGVIMDMGSTAATAASGITITQNDFNATSTAAVLGNVSASSFSSNFIHGGTGTDVFILGRVSAFGITNNTFEAGLGRAVSVSNVGNGSNSDFTITSNSFTGFSSTKLALRVTDYTGNLPATCNWYGTINAAAVAAQIQNTTAGGTITFSPYLSNGTDNSTAIGFQPVPGSCTGNNNPPAITCPGNVTTCQNSNGNYTIPALMASDNCGSRSTTYAITGATVRSGTGEDASGAFNNGTSTITYTVTDGCGNVASCSTTVMINATPVMVTAAPQFTVSGQEMQTIYLNYPSAGGNSGPITLSVPANSGSTYTWTKTGCNANNPMQVQTGSANSYVFNATTMDAPTQTSVTSDNVYKFTVTVTNAAGCFSTADKFVNVVNPLLQNGNYNVCVKSSGRGGGSSVQQTPANQLSLRLASGGVLGNCNTFTGSCINSAARLTYSGAAESEEAMPLEEAATARVISVYPNPTTNGVFVVKLSHITEGATIVISDIQGKTVATQVLSKDAALTATFNLSTLANGMYLLQLKDGDFRYNTKIVVQQ